jgi:phosphoglycolate phosphatase
MKMNYYRAVMFDLDGTLADTLADLANATNIALTSLGCPTHPIQAYRHMVGDGAHTLLKRTLPADKQVLAPEGLRLMRQHYSEHCFDLTRLYAGIPELILDLRQRGLKLAVLSNKPDDFTRQMVNRYFPERPFDMVRGQLPDVPLKPDPTGALQIAGALSVPAPQWLYLGDTNTDMRTATAAGMFPVGVLWGFRDRTELEQAGARALISQPHELLPLLG